MLNKLAPNREPINKVKNEYVSRTTNRLNLPKVRPANTILPSSPYYALSMPKSFLITTDPAGSVPWSMFANRLMKKIRK